MFTPKLLTFSFVLVTFSINAQESGPNLGKIATEKMITRWNLNVFPNGDGLPAGQGNASSGKQVYTQYCQSCHGLDGTGDSAEELAGANHQLTDQPPDKTIGTYWPYATTLFDFTRRSMPLDSPGILSNNQVYAVTAYLLFLNGIISQETNLSANSLAKIKMPNRDGFINHYQQENFKK